MDQFPRRPLSDRVIVREIPIEEYYEQPEGIVVDLQNTHIRERSDRGVIVAIGRGVNEVAVGETVFFDEFCMSDPVFLNPAHKNRPDLPKYWQIREDDLKGAAVVQTVADSSKREFDLGFGVNRTVDENGNLVPVCGGKAIRLA
jgi:co-chaperonin GroES (HSP10)